MDLVKFKLISIGFGIGLVVGVGVTVFFSLIAVGAIMKEMKRQKGGEL